MSDLRCRHDLLEDCPDCLRDEIASLRAQLAKQSTDLLAMWSGWKVRALKAEAQLASARKALEPFVSLRDQSVHQTVKIINKTMDGLTPINVTVTKDQYKVAMSALSDEEGKS